MAYFTTANNTLDGPTGDASILGNLTVGQSISASGLPLVLNPSNTVVVSSWSATPNTALNVFDGVGNLQLSIDPNLGLRSSVNTLDDKRGNVQISGQVVINQTQNTAGNGFYTNEIFFQDNGQIRSNDNCHRLIFDRSNNSLELRCYGSILFSPGSYSGGRTNKLVAQDNGAVYSGHGNYLDDAYGNSITNGYIMQASFNSNVAASGLSQANATLLSKAINVVTSANATSNGVSLPNASVLGTSQLGASIKVLNQSPLPILVYPPVGGSLNGTTGTYVANVATSHTFHNLATNSWYGS